MVALVSLERSEEAEEERSVSAGGRPRYAAGAGRSVCDVWSELEPGPRRTGSAARTGHHSSVDNTQPGWLISRYSLHADDRTLI